MRKIRFTSLQFNNFVYPNVAHNNAKGDGEWETALRLVKILKDPAKTKEMPLSKGEIEAQEMGRAAYPNHCLLDDEAEFLVQDDEWRMIRDKVKAGRDTVLITASEDFEATLQAIEDAEKIEVEEKAKPETEPDPEPEPTPDPEPED